MIRTISIGWGLAFLLSGCGGQSGQSSTAFGGEGAQVEGPDSKPLPPEDDRPKLTGPCAKVPPPGEDAMLDDFEDGDHQLFKTYHREGWWYTATDGTEEASVFPAPGEFRPTELAQEQRSNENEMALHLSADGMTDWGVRWGASLSWKKEGIACPFNASAFDGVKFRAKGTGRVTFKISTIETVPPEHGGVCKKGCWDDHMKVVRMKEEWTEYFIPWESLQQGGWGTDSRFDPERLLSLNFTAGPKDMPVDFWVDDIYFIKKGEKPVTPPPVESTVEGDQKSATESTTPQARGDGPSSSGKGSAPTARPDGESTAEDRKAPATGTK